MIDLLNGNFLLIIIHFIHINVTNFAGSICFQLISVQLLEIFSMLRISYFYEKNQKVKY